MSVKRGDFVVKGEVLDILESTLFDCRQAEEFVENPELLSPLCLAIQRIKEIPEPVLTKDTQFDCRVCANFDDSEFADKRCPYIEDCFICQAWTGRGLSGLPSIFKEKRRTDA